jgi:hypothetical protein
MVSPQKRYRRRSESATLSGRSSTCSKRSVGSYMASNKIKRPLVCRKCGREGEFVYEKTSTGSKGPRINHESLTPGFRFKDTGYAVTATIVCNKCNEVVFPYSNN